jgi:hypothetical protein
MAQERPGGTGHGSVYRVNFVRAFSSRVVVLPHVSTRVRENTSLEWFLPYVAEAVEWPIDHIALHTLGVTVRYVHRFRDRTATLLEDLASTAGHQDRIIPVVVELLPPPLIYNGVGHCVCDFWGCCCLCSVPSASICEGCGNNGCCRAGDCGHPCCEGGAGLGDVRLLCERQGCRPWWYA